MVSILITTLQDKRGKGQKGGFSRAFRGLWVEFLDNFFKTARIATVWSDELFDGWMGRQRRKGVLGHNFDLRGRKRSVSTPIILKRGDLSSGRKRGRLVMDLIEFPRNSG